MIIFRMWQTEKRNSYHRRVRTWHGYFLLGIIPLFIKMVEEKRLY